jgi:hypothetical protein
VSAVRISSAFRAVLVTFLPAPLLIGCTGIQDVVGALGSSMTVERALRQFAGVIPDRVPGWSLPFQCL